MSLFSGAHDAFRRRLRHFVEEHLTPHADEWEEQRAFPRVVLQQLGGQGFLGLTRSRECGGQGLDFAYDVVLAEELPRSKMLGLTLSILTQNNLCMPLLDAFGSVDQKSEFLAPIVRGEMVGAIASTEPQGGSDLVGAIECTARAEGDFWVIQGEKKFITNAPIADFVVTLVRTREERSTYSLTFVIVPTATPGFQVKETLRKLGMHTSPTGWIAFDSCRVPKQMTVGKPGLGYFYHTKNLFEERLIAGVSSLAVASLVLDDTISFVRQRVAYGKPLSELQTVRHRIVELAAELEVSRRFVYSVCESYRDGKLEAKEIVMLKFHVIEVVQRLVERCLQLHGAHGFLDENWITRVYRDVRMLSWGGGVSELMKDLAAGYLRL